MTYKEWRRAIVAAIRAERQNWCTPERGANTKTRLWRALELRRKRKAMQRLTGVEFYSEENNYGIPD